MRVQIVKCFSSYLLARSLLRKKRLEESQYTPEHGVLLAGLHENIHGLPVQPTVTLQIQQNH